MFEARLTEGGTLKKLMETIKDLVEECNFDCSPSGMSLQAMDSSHVALVTMFLKSAGFEMYRCDHKLSLGVSLEEMNKILRCADNDDEITLQAEKDSDKLGFMFETDSQSRISNFEMKLMNIEMEYLAIPDRSYEVSIEMPSGEFKRIINELSIIGDTVKIVANKEGVRFSAEGDTSTGTIMVKQSKSVDNEGSEVNIQVENEVTMSFAIRYLKHFSKAASLSDKINIRMSDELPVLFEFNMGDQGDLGHLRFFLAPKIDEDDESDDDDEE